MPSRKAPVAETTLSSWNIGSISSCHLTVASLLKAGIMPSRGILTNRKANDTELRCPAESNGLNAISNAADTPTKDRSESGDVLLPSAARTRPLAGHQPAQLNPTRYFAQTAHGNALCDRWALVMGVRAPAPYPQGMPDKGYCHGRDRSVEVFAGHCRRP